jgi:metal-responsive CopG/Arc/MetJ family transcriptional regulator
MTTQINIRLDKRLVQEIDALARMLHVPRSEWVRLKLAEMVKESILKYREVLALEYSMGHISFEEMRNALGSDAEDVKMVHEITRKGKKEMDKRLK